MAKVTRALMYIEGQGEMSEQPNIEAAIGLLRNAIQQGNSEAMVLRAGLYLKARSNESNLHRAISLLDDAIERGNTTAILMRHNIYKIEPLTISIINKRFNLMNQLMAHGDTKGLLHNIELLRLIDDNLMINHSISEQDLQDFIKLCCQLMINNPKETQAMLSHNRTLDILSSYKTQLWTEMKKLNLTDPSAFFVLLQDIENSENLPRLEQHPLYAVLSYQTIEQQTKTLVTSLFFQKEPTILQTISRHIELLKPHHEALNETTTVENSTP